MAESLDGFDDRGYHWAEITSNEDTQAGQRVFARGARLDVPGHLIEALADDFAARGMTVEANRLRELLA